MSIVRVISPLELATTARRDGMDAAADFWKSHQKFVENLYVEGEFWADAVARLKRERRYSEAAAICRDQRPLPGAYRDLLICIRAMLKMSDEPDSLCSELYGTAVEATVLNRVRYIEYKVDGHTTGCPGFNAASILFERMASRPLAIEYRNIGYEQVEWLNRTDCSRLQKRWGDPEVHSDPFELFAAYWRDAVGEVQAREQRRNDEFREAFARVPAGEIATTPDDRQRKGWLSRLLGR